MNVDTILRTKGARVETARSDWTVARVCARLTELDMGALVVSDDGATVAGIVSERDVIRRIAADGPAVLDRPVAEVMVRDVVTCKRSDNIARLREIMTERRMRHLPVTEGDRLVGIVSIGDVVKHRIRETEHEAEALREYITTG